jgi:hypothetical protein
MFKEFQAGLSKFFTKKWIPIIVLLVICFVLIAYSSYKGTVLDRMTDGASSFPSPSQMANPPSILPVGTANAVSAPTAGAGSTVQPPTGGYTAQNVATPSDLLPKDQNSQWATLNPVGGNVAIPDLLQAGYHIGLDTIGQTLKNANYQLRSDPIIEKQNTGPWLQSTIEPDYARIPLEIGQGQR